MSQKLSQQRGAPLCIVDIAGPAVLNLPYPGINPSIDSATTKEAHDAGLDPTLTRYLDKAALSGSGNMVL